MQDKPLALLLIYWPEIFDYILLSTYHEKLKHLTVRFVNKGVYSQVLGIHKSEGKKGNKVVTNLAVKIPHPEKIKKSELQHAQNEIDILVHLDSDHVIQLLASLIICDYRDLPIVFMEYCQTDLFNYLQRNPQAIIDMEIPTIVLRASKGIAYLHDKGIIHRDIKQENLLRDPDGDWKWCDFGFSMKVPNGESIFSHSLLGTRQYLAPEICFDEPHEYSIYSDYWAHAMLRLEIANNCQLDGLENAGPVGKTESFKAFIDGIRRIEISGRSVNALIQEVSKTPGTKGTGATPLNVSFYNISSTVPHRELSDRISKVNCTLKQVLAILSYFSLAQEDKELRINEQLVISLLEEWRSRNKQQAATQQADSTTRKTKANKSGRKTKANKSGRRSKKAR